MGNHSILPFGASLIAVVLGCIVYAQQEAPLSNEESSETAASLGGEIRPHRFRGVFPSRISGRGKQSNDTLAWDIDSEPSRQDVVIPPPQSEAPFLEDLAEWLSVPIPENATPGDIALAIKQALSERVTSPDTVLSDESFKECYEAIPTTRDAEIFKAYHTFIKKVEGKKVIPINYENF